MALKLAFMGFRHGHILDVYKRASQRDDIQIVAACEEDAATRKSAPPNVTITHDNFAAMLDTVECDAVAIGDYYGRRGAIAIEALRRRKHVISDKPLCTNLAELDQIEQLATDNGLAVGCQFDMVHDAKLHALRELIHSGRLGNVHQILIGGQHPLNYGSRPGWYFEQGKHGGTLNDIGIHAVHELPWITGKRITQVIAARTWNAFATQVPHFMDSAQAMLTLEGGCGVMIDVSYAMPRTHGYSLVQYWRQTYFGSKGIAETSAKMDHVAFAEDGKKEIEQIRPAPQTTLDYLSAFVQEASGKPGPSPLTTTEILTAQRQSLALQQAADLGTRDVSV